VVELSELRQITRLIGPDHKEAFQEVVQRRTEAVECMRMRREWRESCASVEEDKEGNYERGRIADISRDTKQP
jgi:hypothetical protein